MTTPQAEKLYEAQHVYNHAHLKNEVYNPRNLSLEKLPVIYGFNNGGPYGLMSAVLIAEDGTVLGGHCCSSEAYMPADLGVLKGTRPDRHDGFRKHYPDGYRMEFVGNEEVPSHQKLQEAFLKNKALKPKPEDGK